MKTIAWLGLGAMGSQMAARLVNQGHEVVVYNRSSAAVDALVARGARAAQTPAEATAGADVVVAMLSDDEAPQQVWSDPETGAFTRLKAGCVVVESSTLTTAWTQQWARRATQCGARAVAAPVAGTTPQAEAGALIYFAGATSPDALDDLEPLLLCMGQAIHRLSSPREAAFVKLAVNSIFASQVCVLGEVLAAGRALGVEPGGLVEVLNQVPVTSPALKGISGLILKDHRAPMFPIDLVEKDMRYMNETTAAPLPCLEVVRAQYARASERGMGGQNINAVARLHVRDDERQ